MLYPAVAELEKKTNSRYALVILIAKRARQIAEKADENQIDLPDKPVKMAIMDVANGKVAIKAPDLAAPEPAILEENEPCP
ncbi:MAG: DNA-directed RNA polymerase subunit omega [Clostridiales bacterium]|nr:MAG: DNA-directed RNA polymerase subunit omega [Clostridiales bacterium]